MHTAFISPLKYMYIIKPSLELFFAHVENHEIPKNVQMKSTERQLHAWGCKDEKYSNILNAWTPLH
jgi:hypothetical protein